VAVPTLPASPPDLTTLITSFAVLSIAIAAAVSGVWRGLQIIKKSGSSTGQSVSSAVLIETTTLTILAENNRTLAETMLKMVEPLEQIERHLERLCNELPAHDMRMRANTEEMHRLRVSVTDLHERIRSQRL
jgi:hypothetical protein